jgi:hypothetical protein
VLHRAVIHNSKSGIYNHLVIYPFHTSMLMIKEEREGDKYYGAKLTKIEPNIPACCHIATIALRILNKFILFCNTLFSTKCCQIEAVVALYYPIFHDTQLTRLSI